MSSPKEGAPYSDKLFPVFQRARSAALGAFFLSYPDGLQPNGTAQKYRLNLRCLYDKTQINVDIIGEGEKNPEANILGRNGDKVLVQGSTGQLQIVGFFTSARGSEGILDLMFGNNIPPYEAYWLKNSAGLYQIEQVVSAGGVYIPDNLTSRGTDVLIPDTETWVPSLIHRS